MFSVPFSIFCYNYYNSATVFQLKGEIMRNLVFAVLTVMLFVSASYGAHPLITDDAGTMGKS